MTTCYQPTGLRMVHTLGSASRKIALSTTLLASAALVHVACSDFGGESTDAAGIAGDPSGAGQGGAAAGGAGVGGAGAVGASGSGGQADDLYPIARLDDVDFRGGRFVAVGTLQAGELSEVYEPLMFSSEDGERWTRVDEGPPARAIVAGGEVWVANAPGNVPPPGYDDLYADPEFFVSDDGISWRDVGGEIPFYASPIWTGSSFLTYGWDADEEGGMWESVDGESWERIAGSVARGPLALVPGAIAAGGYEELGFSTDGGHTWEMSPFSELIGDEGPRGPVTSVYSDGQRYWAASAYDCCFGEIEGTQEHYLLSSEDRVNWTWQEADYAPKVAFFLNGVGVALNFEHGKLLNSDAAGGWQLAEYIYPIDAIALGEGPAGPRFVAVGIGTALFSDDGLSWHAGELPIGQLP